MSDEEKLKFIEDTYKRFLEATNKIQIEYWKSIRAILKDIDDEKIKEIRKKLAKV